MNLSRFTRWMVALPLLLSLSSCTLDGISARQEKATGLWDELLGGENFGQSFVSTQPHLYRIDLGTATYARTNSAAVVFHLQTSPQATADLVSVTLAGPEIRNDRPTMFEFAPLADSEGQSYYFYIESPGATPGNAITVYANAQDQYPDGMAYRNGRAIAGDLAFTAYSRQVFSLPGILREFLSRALQDLSFFVCYGVLILGLSAGLLAFLRKRRLPDPPADGE
jgi:hypothetical protein